ncbi:hypothetical protein [Leptospira andrefontaineae]|uniref:Uncharacterized protein n=1 Tax=Leptospira andrefontaineae TaxID=2484976 RepID=A0A4R9GY35_9LEPT|nr:hypothetical protein [Leptospira andrefontaineae]TGK36248.1 hypothetical protein EHO65_18265 [Leptospira andrefontaineae]
MEKFTEITGIKLSRTDKIHVEKYSDLDLGRYTISSFNRYRDNRMLWALEYVFRFKSAWPAEGLWRQSAIDKVIQRAVLLHDMEMPGYVETAIQSYQFYAADHLLTQFEKLSPEFQAEDLASILCGNTKEEFLNAIKGIIQTKFDLKLYGPIPEFMDPDHSAHKKYLERLEKQYVLIEQGIPKAVEYFQKIEEPITFRKRIKANYFGIPVPTFGFGQFVTKSRGYILKSSEPNKVPKTWEKVSLNDKCKLAFAAVTEQRPWELVVTTRQGRDDARNLLLLDMIKAGLGVTEICNKFKEISLKNGDLTASGKPKSVTADTVEKLILAAKEPGFQPPSIFRKYEMMLEEAIHWEKHNELTANSINFLVHSCRKKSINDDIKTLCFDNIEGMLVKPDERRKIEELWGLEIPDTTEQEEQEEAA